VPNHFTASHWGIYEVDKQTGEKPQLRSYSGDPDPSPIGLDQINSIVSRLRISKPAIRESWLRNGPGANGNMRGRERFVEVDWDTALAMVAEELDRIRGEYGNSSIFGGSYGWSSAGRFHHAQSQVHRFLNMIGGYVRHVDTYSLGAGRVIMPHVVGHIDDLQAEHTSWDVIGEHCRLFISFGGVPLKNSRVSPGGAGRHRVREALDNFARKGGKLISISPIRHCPIDETSFEWIPIRPNTDTALMLALCHELFVSGVADTAFLEKYCSGAEYFQNYVTGKIDGTAKSSDWAERITGIPSARIKALAHEARDNRTMVNCAWSLQRAQHGEQPFWALVALASVLGQIGFPGGGFGLGYGAMNAIGSAHPRLKGPSLPQGKNSVSEFIPVARISHMLLQPGETFTYEGASYKYPDIRLVYWAGGNPFHHHQDINRLRRAWARPDTIIVHEQFWNPAARMADIVLPATLAVERNDMAFATREGVLTAMRQIVEPHAEARNDFTIFSQLADRLGMERQFTQDMSEMEWLRHLYGSFSENARSSNIELPEFNRFWEQGLIDFSDHDRPVIFMQAFRNDCQANPLPTPSGKIELFSAQIAAADITDCPGHPAWLEPDEWLGSKNADGAALHLISDQPERRLHSQLDHAAWSLAGKSDGREYLLVNSADARERNIRDGDIIEIYNQRGRCQAVAAVSEEIMPGVVRLATGAWFDPAQDIDAHGNPNMLTSDRPASGFSQGCAALTCLVKIIRNTSNLTPSAHELPELVVREFGKA
jgi:biotin/methionine sulfoxide reductase